MSIVTGTVSNGITLGQAGFTSPLLVTHTGTVSNGTGAAVYASGTYPNPVVLNQGVILDTGAFAAVALNDGGIVANLGNSALIQGYTGIDISGASGLVTNSGTIDGSGFAGVAFAAGGIVANNGKSALIEGYNGIVASGAPGLVTNSGTIAGTAAYGGGVVLEAGGRIQNSGLIEGGPPVVAYFQGQYYLYKFHIGGAVSIGGSTGTVSNSGTIVGTNFAGGIFLALGGSVENTGFIQGGIQSGVDIFGLIVDPGGPCTVTNSGSITGGVNLVAGGSVVNSGYIEGRFGVASHGAATVANSGTILGTDIYYEGVFLLQGGSLENTGLIQGGFGVRTGGAAALTNSGEIVGTGFTRGGVDMEGGGLSSAANTGLILGQDAGGVYVSYYGGGVGAVTNTGTIEGTGSIPVASLQQRHNGGVFLGAGGSVTNSGLIQGASGVYVGKAAGSVTNSGVIAGTGLAGVVLAAGGDITDSGTIIGGNGTAVSFGGSGGNLLALEAGYDLVGAVTVAGAVNTLELLGAAGAVTVDFDKPGAGFSSFSTVAFAVSGNHTETLAITDTTVLPGIVSGFTQRHDIVDLTQLAPQHATATLNAADQLVVSNGSQSVSLQLDPSGNYSGVVWQARPDGSGGADVAVIHPGDPAPPAASTAAFGFAAATATGGPPAPQYKNGASLTQTLNAGTPLEHLILASGHGPPFG